MRLIANKRSVATILIAIALLGVIASTQTWVSYWLDPATSVVPQLDVSGVDAQPLAFSSSRVGCGPPSSRALHSSEGLLLSSARKSLEHGPARVGPDLLKYSG